MEVAKTKTAPMKQKHTLQWLSAVAGKAKLLVGILVAVQAMLSVSSVAFAFSRSSPAQPSCSTAPKPYFAPVRTL